MKLPVITDSTTGAVSATFTLDDTTTSVKDDQATMIAIIELLKKALVEVHQRLEVLENA